jgi:hypothetical protein
VKVKIVKLLLQKLYKLIFWSGYTAVLVTSMMNLPGALDEIKVNMLAFNLRLDHLLHFLAYFSICLYFLAGQRKGLALFRNHQLRKFVVATLTLAMVTEILQLWVPTRSFNVMDMVANVSGIALGVIVIKIQVKDRRSKIEDSRSKKSQSPE